MRTSSYAAAVIGQTWNGWMPQLTAKMQRPFAEVIPEFRKMAEDAGRDPDSLSISVWGRQPVYDEIAAYADLGVERICTSLESETAETILPQLDTWAELRNAIGAR